jgi:hypothetical protein
VIREIDLDPTGEHHGGMPTWPWNYGPKPTEGLATRRQLRAMGLRKGGQDVAAQLVRGEDSRLVAYLYRVDLALPVRPMTPAKWASLAKAMAARRTCPICQVTYDWHLQLRKLGSCRPCWQDAQPPEPEPIANAMTAYWDSLAVR